MTRKGVIDLECFARDVLDLYIEAQEALMEQGIMCLGLSGRQWKKEKARLKRELNKAYNAAKE